MHTTIRQETYLHSAIPSHAGLTPISSPYPWLIVPGLGDSDSAHWQSLWHEHLPNSHRIEMRDWLTPDLQAWSTAIRERLQQLSKPAVLIAHSFGALAAAKVANEWPTQVAGIFLVAPADPDKFGLSRQLPKRPLPVAARLIASSNDPWLSEARAFQLALRWGADYQRFAQVGHINSHSNLGVWPQGWEELRKLVNML